MQLKIDFCYLCSEIKKEPIKEGVVELSLPNESFRIALCKYHLEKALALFKK